MPKAAAPIEERFWSHVNKEGPIPECCPELGPCWLWELSCVPFGYGQTSWNSDKWRTHRLAYWLAHGPFDLSLQILHRCDNPPCVNPTHLFLGTNSDNMRDRREKDHYPRGDTHRLRLHPELIKKGRQLTWTKLTEDLAMEIRLLAITTNLSSAELGLQFGVSKATIKDLLHGRTWKYVGYPPEYDRLLVDRKRVLSTTEVKISKRRDKLNPS